MLVTTKLRKYIPGTYQSVSNLKKDTPNLKKIMGRGCTWYIPSVSFLVQNCKFLSYALHIAVITFSSSTECCWRMKFNLNLSRQLNCNTTSAYHCTAFIKHNKICLPLVSQQAPFVRPRRGRRPRSWRPPAPAPAQAPAATCAGGNGGSLQRSLRGLGSDTATKFEGSWRRLSTRSLDAQHVLVVCRQQVMQGLKKSGYAAVVGGIISFVVFFRSVGQLHRTGSTILVI